jgi:hypothetical protein
MVGDFFGEEVMGVSCFELGFPPYGRAYFLLCGQKKVAKEKATPGSAPGYARFPALLGLLGGWLNSPAAQTTPADGPQQPCVARHLPRGPVNRPMLNRCCSDFDFCHFLAVDRSRPISRLPVEPRRLSGPLRGAEQRRLAGGSRLALFEPQASSGKPPGLPSSARNRACPAPTQGSLFLCLLSFGEAKESETPSRRNPKPIEAARRANQRKAQHA